MRVSSRAKNVPSRKKLPSNVKENGIVGNPAGPTTAPGGSVTVAAWLAAAGDAPDAPGAPEAPDTLDAPDPPEAPDPLEPLAGAGVDRAGRGLGRGGRAGALRRGPTRGLGLRPGLRRSAGARGAAGRGLNGLEEHDVLELGELRRTVAASRAGSPTGATRAGGGGVG